jgi:hypothetical protein
LTPNCRLRCTESALVGVTCIFPLCPHFFALDSHFFPPHFKLFSLLMEASSRI